MTTPDKKADFSGVSSSVDTTAKKERDKADFSGVSASVDTTAEKIGGSEQTYTVERGDTLSQIAKQFYGEVFGWQFHDVPEMNYTMHIHTRAGAAISATKTGILPICQDNMRFFNRGGFTFGCLYQDHGHKRGDSEAGTKTGPHVSPLRP